MERLSGMDAFFLYFESPTQHMHVTLCAVLDPAGLPHGYTFERIRDRIASRVHLIPPFTRRLVPVPLRLHHPIWVDDPDFDLDYHVRRAALPAPGDDERLAELTATVASVPLDRTRPLWEAWLVEALADGRFAVIIKVHHAALDGVAGVETLVKLFDFEQDPPPDDPPPERVVEEIPSDLELVTHATVSKAKGALDFLPLARRTMTSFVAVRTKRAEPDARVGGTPLGTPYTPLNGTISGRRRVAFARVPLDDVKAARAAVPGSTVNDVILAGCGGALRRYLDSGGELPDEPLVAACPINVRGEHQQGRSDNRVSAMFVRLHTEVADPTERLRLTHESTTAAKEEHALFGDDTLQQWAEIADPNLFSVLSDLYTGSGMAARHRPAFNVMISNLPGPPFPLFLAGARLERAYPMGPIAEGIGLNITVMSYCGSVDVGFMAAANLVPDVADLAAAVGPAFAELTKAAG